MVGQDVGSILYAGNSNRLEDKSRSSKIIILLVPEQYSCRLKGLGAGAQGSARCSGLSFRR